MNILEDFWYGNIEPSEYDTSTCLEYKEAHQLINQNEDRLRVTMTDAQKELFTRYQESVMEYQTLSELMLFQNSFNPGS